MVWIKTVSYKLLLVAHDIVDGAPTLSSGAWCRPVKFVLLAHYWDGLSRPWPTDLSCRQARSKDWKWGSRTPKSQLSLRFSGPWKKLGSNLFRRTKGKAKASDSPKRTDALALPIDLQKRLENSRQRKPRHRQRDHYCLVVTSMLYACPVAQK